MMANMNGYRIIWNTMHACKEPEQNHCQINLHFKFQHLLYTVYCKTTFCQWVFKPSPHSKNWSEGTVVLAVSILKLHFVYYTVSMQTLSGVNLLQVNEIICFKVNSTS